MTFEQLELDDSLCAALAARGIEKPTGVQQLTIPAALTGRDICATAPTGTGKTLAFLLPIMQHIIDLPKYHLHGPRALILVPTRELAIQIAEQAKTIAPPSIDCAVITGGINYGSDHDAIERKPHILIATPGRLLEHIDNERIDCRDIEFLVIDEADRMLDMGFLGFVEKIAAEAQWRKQNFMFSATMDASIQQSLGNIVLEEPLFIETDASRKERPKIVAYFHHCDDRAHKEALLIHHLQHSIETAVVFVKTRDRVQEVASLLQQHGIRSVYLQGEMPQDKRNIAIERIKDGRVNVLIATDVAARGIDLPNLSHVINFDMPRTADVYVHRIGRTGRAGRKGCAISLVEAHDIEMVSKVSRYVGEPLKARVVDALRPKHKAPSLPPKKKKKKKLNARNR